MIIYFIADKKSNHVNDALIDDVGLRYAFDVGQSITRVDVNAGPSGGQGVCIGRDGSTVGFYPTLQTWEQSVTNPEVWIGYPQELEPLSMVRDFWKGEPLRIPSRNLESLNGRSWPVPLARAWSDTGWINKLPRTIKFNGSEFVSGDVVSRFQKLEEYATEILEMMIAGEMPDGFYLYCSKVFSEIYYVGPQEFGRLEVVTTEPGSAWSLLSIVIDEQGLNDRIKKKEQSTS